MPIGTCEVPIGTPGWLSQWLVKTRVKKENHLGLILGIKGRVTMNMGGTRTKKEQHRNQGKTYERNLNSELKLKEERKEKESDIWEKKESREYTAELACITRNPFPPLENTKAHSLQSPKDNYFDSCSKSHNFIALFGNKLVWVGLKVFLVIILLWILFAHDYFCWSFHCFFVITCIAFNMN